MLYFGSLFFKFKSITLRNLSVILGIPITILMLLVSPNYLKISQMLPTNYEFNLRTILFMLELSFSLVVPSLLLVYRKTELKRLSIKKALIFIPIIILMLPHGVFSLMFGKAGGNLKAFSTYQLYLLITIVINFVVLYLGLIKRSYQTKYNALLLMSLALLFQYFKIYTFAEIELWNLPIHICNMATILIFISLFFKPRRLFLFTYFINVFGATMALLTPLINDDFLAFSTFNFMFEHMLVLIIPILTVILDVEARPKVREISKIIPLFTGYYIFSIVFGSIFFIYDNNVNYFYVIKDTIAQFLPFLMPLRNISYQIGKVTIYPVYWLVIYVGIIIIMYGINALYIYVYSLEDLRIEMRAVKEQELKFKQMRLEADVVNEDQRFILEVNNISKTYKNNHEALKPISFKLEQGDILWLLGHNGAGKSTLIKTIIGINLPTNGEVIVCGYNTNVFPNEAKKCIGYAPDDHAQYEKLTANEYLDYIATLYGLDLAKTKVLKDEYLKSLNLDQVANNLIETYSHGMKQKLSLIASILHEPKLLVLDEPLSGLDFNSIEEIKSFLSSYAKKGNAIIYSAHQYDVNNPLCNKAMGLNQGVLEFNKEIKTQDDINNLKQYYKNIGIKGVIL